MSVQIFDGREMLETVGSESPQDVLSLALRETVIFKSDFFHRGKRLHGGVHEHWTLSPLPINLQHDFMSRKCLPCVAQDTCQGTGPNPFLFAPPHVRIGNACVSP